MLLDRLGRDIAEAVADSPQMRGRVVRAAQRLLDEPACAAASRELVRAGQHDTVPAAEEFTKRAAVRFLRRLDASST